MNLILVILGKLFITTSQIFNLGNGSTWPGHIALSTNPKFIKESLKKTKTKIILVAGTNGKTTTGALISHIFLGNNKSVIHNSSGANLLNGLASAIISSYNISFARPGLARLDADYLVFEVDENALPKVLENLTPNYVICLNLFRDQLDRYGEIDSISRRWKEAFRKIDDRTTLILNADDPQISYLGKDTNAKIKYFGLDEKGIDVTKHGADSIYCPKCSTKLNYEKVFYSHLGIWNCPNCKIKRPSPENIEISSNPLPGIHNKYNLQAAITVALSENTSQILINDALNKFTPAFGRGEKIVYKGKTIQLFLSKNPTSFNQSLDTIKDLGGKNIMFILNDAIPDGKDISWIWDINLEEILTKDMNIGVTGNRMLDMSLRIKYSEFFAHHNTNTQILLDNMVNSLDSDETLYILPNYSAMLDIRKILTGKKIL